MLKQVTSEKATSSLDTSTNTECKQATSKAPLRQPLHSFSNITNPFLLSTVSCFSKETICLMQVQLKMYINQIGQLDSKTLGHKSNILCLILYLQLQMYHTVKAWFQNFLSTTDVVVRKQENLISYAFAMQATKVSLARVILAHIHDAATVFIVTLSFSNEEKRLLAQSLKTPCGS